MMVIGSILGQHKKNLLLYIPIATVICVGLLYTLFSSNTNIRKNTADCRAKLVPVEELCYQPDGNVFPRNRLKQVQVKKLDNISAYQNESDASKLLYLPKNYSSLVTFIESTRTAILSRRWTPKSHSITTIFRIPPYKDMIRPSCDGLWAEFGVFHGQTLFRIAKWKANYCGNKSQKVYGFDTFTGLPADWRPGFTRGSFALANGTQIKAPSNVALVKGLFIDTLPIQLRLIDNEYRCKIPVSFVHIDCDLYEGARDVLFLLGSRFIPGTVVVFDELFNYPGYQQHEIKALYEFLSGSNLQLIPLGTSDEIYLQPTNDIPPHSFAFVVDSNSVH